MLKATIVKTMEMGALLRMALKASCKEQQPVSLALSVLTVLPQQVSWDIKDTYDISIECVWLNRDNIDDSDKNNCKKGNDVEWLPWLW